MHIDPSITAEENIISAINHSNNGANFTVEDMSFGTPTEYDDVNHPEANTQVVATGTGNYNGTLPFFFRRTNLSKEIVYRKYKGGDYASIQDFLTHLGTVNSVRSDNLEIDITDIPDGTRRTTAIVTPISGSLLYVGSQKVIFDYKDGYVPPAVNPNLYYDVTIPAGSLNDGYQVFPTDSLLSGDITIDSSNGTVIGVHVDFARLDNGIEYPALCLIDMDGFIIATLSHVNTVGVIRTYHLSTTGSIHIGEVSTLRFISVSQLTASNHNSTSITINTITTSIPNGTMIKRTIKEVDVATSCIVVLEFYRKTVNAVTNYYRRITLVKTSTSDTSVPVESSIWDRLGDVAVGNVTLKNASGTLIWEGMPTYEIMIEDASISNIWSMLAITSIVSVITYAP